MAETSGISGVLKDAAKWWLGDGAAAEAADDVDSRTRKQRIDCVTRGGTWDPDQRKCIMGDQGE